MQVHDLVLAGEMPPKTKTQPEPAERAALLAALAAPLAAADAARQAERGRSVIRRVNRAEYEGALSDLLGLPLRIRELLPADALGHGFDTVGAALNVSSVQMEAYLAALDVALDRATTLIERPETVTRRLSYLETTGMMEEFRLLAPIHPLPDGLAIFGPEKHAHLGRVFKIAGTTGD